MRAYAGPPVLTVALAHPQYGTWGEATIDTRDRAGIYPGSNVVTSSMLQGGAMDAHARLLSNDELWAVYRQTPEVRASIESIVRVISTWDWYIEPVETIPKDDALYDIALDAAEEARRFLSAPNEDGEVWQTWCSKSARDLLVYDAWATENVFGPGGSLEELVTLPGGTVHPRVDRHQRVVDYKQVTGDAEVFLDRDQVVYFNLFPNSQKPGGTPLIETLINEVITLLRSSKHLMLAYDADEVAPGVLLLAGIAGQAADRAVASLRNMRGADHKLRVLTTNNPRGLDAKWVEFRHTPKDLDMKELVKEIRRTVWRVFGVKPITMGDTESTPRATAEVQVEAEDSGLIRPIIELLQAQMNMRILPLIVGADMAGLVQFRFDLDRDATAADSKAEAEADGMDFDRGGLTINELRVKRGRLPVEGGDVALIKAGAGYVTLDKLLGDGTSPSTTLYDAGNDDDGHGQVDDASSDAATPEEGEEAPGEIEASRVWAQRAPERYSHINFTPPKGVRSECQRGVDWVDEGEGGDGLKPETVTWARRLARGEDITPDKARKMKAWLARHEVDKQGEGFNPGEDGYPSPGRVAWACWGGDPAVGWSKKLVDQMDAADREDKSRAKAPRIGSIVRASRPVVRVQGRHAHGCSCGNHRSEPTARFQGRSSLLPSEWQPQGKFKGYRTVNLTTLGRVLIDYARTVEPLYRKARIETVAAFRAYASDGEVSTSDAAALASRVSSILDRLHKEWDGATAGLYRDAAQIGRDAAADFTGVAVVADWRDRAELYQRQAMAYLVDSRGLLSDIKSQLQTLIAASVRGTDINSLVTRAEGVDALDVIALLGAVAKVFSRNEHRIDNWSGRLVELCNSTLVRGMEEGSVQSDGGDDVDGTPGDPGPSGEWYVEWAAVGDNKMCPTCAREGAAGFRPLRSLPTEPGGATECRANCRCVLVFWTREEVQSGKATALSGQM